MQTAGTRKTRMYRKRLERPYGFSMVLCVLTKTVFKVILDFCDSRVLVVSFIYQFGNVLLTVSCNDLGFHIKSDKF